MRTQDAGHHFWLQNYAPKEGEWPQWGEQDVQFFKRIGEDYPGNSGQLQDGTNCQEVLRALIYRVKYLDGQRSCQQNIRILELLRNALYLFEFRAAERKGKLSEFFKMLEIRSDLVGIEDVEACRTCGHLFPHTHEAKE